MDMTKIPKIPTRKIIALSLTATYIFLLVNQIPVPDQFMGVFGLIIGCYYGKSTALDMPHSKEGDKQ